MSLVRTITAALPPAHVTERGACREEDPDIFFPERGQSTAEGKAVCERCPVRQDCLEWAIATNQGFGIWGGKSTRERRQLRRHLAATGTLEGATGKRPRLTDDQIAAARARYAAGGVTQRQLAKDYGIAHQTMSSHLRGVTPPADGRARPPRLWHDTKPCGTPAACRRHLRRGEKPCAACYAANRLYTAERREQASREAS